MLMNPNYINIHISSVVPLALPPIPPPPPKKEGGGGGGGGDSQPQAAC